MNEIEAKVDMLISGMVLPQKRTRRRVATIVATVLIATTLITSASLITFYYQQTGTVEVTSLITITYDGVVYDAGWTETETIGGDGDPVFYEGTEYISEIYTIMYASSPPAPAGDITAYFHIEVTENEAVITNGDGLEVSVYNSDGVKLLDGGQISPIAPGTSHDFTIHVTADVHINAASTYGYTITMDWEGPPPP